MSTLRRHRVFVLLLWLALAWLPLRGVAQVLMHAPAPADPVLSAPCHAGHAAAEMPSGDDPSGAAGSACALCDLCHGAALPQGAPLATAEAAPPRVAHVPPLQGQRSPRRLDRPPRG